MGVEPTALGGEKLNRHLPRFDVGISKDELELPARQLSSVEQLKALQHQIRSNSQVGRFVRPRGPSILTYRITH